MSALKRLGFLLYDSNYIQTHKITVQSDSKRVPTLKKACNWKNFRFGPKNLQK